MHGRPILTLFAAALSSCASPPEPATPRAKNNEMVPANSAFEKAPPRPVAPPVEEPVTEVAPPTPLSPPPPPEAPKPPGGGATGPKVSKQECTKLMDRYIALAVGSNAELAGVSKEMISQAMAGATAQKGDPCVTDPPTRAQYTCAMGAKTTGQWESCLR